MAAESPYELHAAAFPQTRPDGHSRHWYTIWWRALTSPTVARFQELLDDSNATSLRAFTWIIIAVIVGTSLALAIRTLWVGLAWLLGGILAPQVPDVWLAIFFELLGAMVLAVLVYWVDTAIRHSVAQTLGGRGTFSQLYFMTAAYTAPLLLLSMILGTVPIIGLLTYVIALVRFGLDIISVRAVYGLGAWTAVLPALASLLIVSVLTFCILTVINP